MEAAPLLRAGVKLAADIKILRCEIADLRETIKGEKRRRKRGKAMGLYDKDGSPSQPLFFSPAKVAQARQRAAEEEQAERQAAEEKEVRSALAREKKAREEERKAQRKQAAEEKRIQSAIAREEKARGVEERKAERAARRAEKLEEAAKRKEEAVAKKAAAREAKERAVAAAKTAAKSKKRFFVGDESEAPRKKPCAKPSRRRNKQDTSNSTIGSVHQAIELEDSALSTVIVAQPVACTRNAGRAPVSRPSRSGRNIKLPARFQ
jgi:hypothetical protein